MSEFTYEDSAGKEFTAKDTADNRVAVENQGYTIKESLSKTITEAARGADEVMGDHIISKYNPAMLIPRGLMKGIASLGDARTNEEIRADKLIYSDSSGKEFTAKNTPENIKSLSEQGYKIHDLTTEGARGMASAFGEQSQNQYLLGIPHMTDTPEEKARHNALAEANPGMNIAGGIVGFGAGMATPGLNMVKGARLAEQGVVRGLEALGVEAGAGLASKAAVTVAKEAAAGAVYSAPRALAEATLNENPKAAAEHLGVGIGIGVLFGLGRFGLGEAAERLTTSAVSAAGETTATRGERMLADQIGLKAKEQANMPPTMMQELVDAGVFTGNKKEIAQNILNLTKENGPKIGDALKSLDKGLEGVVEKGATPTLGEVHGFDFNKVASEVSALGHGITGTLRKAESKIVSDSAEHILAIGEKFANKEGSLPFDEAQKLKVLLQDQAKWDKLGKAAVSTPENNLRIQIATMAKNELEAAADRVSSASGDAKLIAEWGQAKNLYGYSKQLEKAAERSLYGKDSSGLLDAINSAKSIGIGAAAGHVFEHSILGPLGGLAYSAGKKILAKAYNDTGKTKLGLWLMKRASSDDFASYLAVDASAAAKDRINQIPSQIQNMVTQGAIAATTHDPIKAILGADANGLTKEQQFNKYSQHVTEAQSNPERTKARLAELIDPIGDVHTPLGDIMMEDSLKKMEYLYSILPKNPDANQPFIRNEKWKPTTQQLNEHNKLLAVANDPYHVLKELEQGTLTSKQVATLAYLNPEILQSMRDEIIKMAYSGKAVNLSYQQKLNVSLLMGTNMTKSLGYVQPLQAAYGQPAPELAQMAPSRGGHPKADKLPSATFTPAQRIGK